MNPMPNMLARASYWYAYYYVTRTTGRGSRHVRA